MDINAQVPLVDPHVFLIGRPPLAEYFAFMQTMAVGGHTFNQGTLASEWRSANDHLRDLEAREAGLANSPSIGTLDAALGPLQTRVLSDPVFQRTFGIVPTDIGVVELDRLVVFQKYINLMYVERLKNSLGPSPTAEEVLRFCLPFDHPQPPVRGQQIAPNGYVFVSPSNDLRFIESLVFNPAQIPGYAIQGPVAGIVGLVVGFGSNFLNVLHVENRLILNNGSHRAYALRDIGKTHVPCLIQHVSRRDELGVLAPVVEQNPDLYLTSQRPPLLKDYFDPRLRKIVDVARRLRQVRLTFGLEQLDVPAT